MARIGITISIDHPIGRVWDALCDLASHADWMADAESIEFVGDRRQGVGTTMVVRTRVGPLRTDDVMIVTEWVEGRRIGVEHTGLVEGRGVFDLSEVGTGTEFAWSEDLRFPWYLGGPVVAAVAGPILKQIWKKNLERFAASLEV
jgi:carbon monoxide dehydrogenase subunit G